MERLVDFLLGIGVIIAAGVTALLLAGLTAVIFWAVQIVMPLSTFFFYLVCLTFLWFGRHQIMSLGKGIRNLDDK